MRLEQLQYIVEIEKTGSISKAAENLYLTQPSVSAGVSSLEKELKFKIFKRTKSGVAPTAEGERVLLLAREILAKTQEIYDIQNESANANFEVLTIPAVNSGLLGQVFSVWQKSHPDSSLQVREYKVNGVLNEFLQYKSEKRRCFCICAISDEALKIIGSHLQAQHIKYEFLATDYMVGIFCSDNPHTKEKYISKAEFMNLPRICYEYATAHANKPSKDIFANVAYYKEYEELNSGNIKFEVSTLETLRQLIAEDVGVTVMPSIILNNDRYFSDGDIKSVPFSDVKVCLKYYCLYSENEPLNKMEKDFIELMKKKFAQWDKSEENINLNKAMSW